jgi:hypothetical protein
MPYARSGNRTGHRAAGCRVYMSKHNNITKNQNDQNTIKKLRKHKRAHQKDATHIYIIIVISRINIGRIPAQSLCAYLYSKPVPGKGLR